MQRDRRHGSTSPVSASQGERSRVFRWLMFGLTTLLGIKRQGFFIPYRYAASVQPGGYPALHHHFVAAEPRFSEMMAVVEAYADDLRRIASGPGPARFDQDWFPRLDAAVAYALVRRERPRRIVEIGSGHSTRFLARAATDAGLSTQIVCIDPAPRMPIASFNVRHEPCLLRDVDPSVFAELSPGDILFIDSSHIAMPGTDVDRLILDIIPRLAQGVLVHVHDIFLPDGYPAEWAWRGYNEQLLIGVLIEGGACELLFASRYVATRRPEIIRRSIVGELPLVAGAFETSFWVRKRKKARCLGTAEPRFI
jgi:predicted O-methyltransferase YrrM